MGQPLKYHESKQFQNCPETEGTVKLDLARKNKAKLPLGNLQREAVLHVYDPQPMKGFKGEEQHQSWTKKQTGS